MEVLKTILIAVERQWSLIWRNEMEGTQMKKQGKVLMQMDSVNLVIAKSLPIISLLVGQELMRFKLLQKLSKIQSYYQKTNKRNLSKDTKKEIWTRIKQRSLAKVLKQFTLIHQVHCQIKSLRELMTNKVLLSIMSKMEATGRKSSLQKELVKKRKIGRAIPQTCPSLRERNSLKIIRIFN